MSDTPGSSDTATAIHTLMGKIERLMQQQADALSQAVFGGMTPDEEMAFNSRRDQIAKLLEQLDCLNRAA